MNKRVKKEEEKLKEVSTLEEVKKLDLQLNEHGEWLLVGAIACFSLPPMLCTINAVILMWVRLIKYDSTIKELNHKILKKQIEDNPKRDKLIFTVGFWSIIAAIVYGIVKMGFQCTGKINYEWFVKVFWGSL